MKSIAAFTVVVAQLCALGCHRDKAVERAASDSTPEPATAEDGGEKSLETRSAAAAGATLKTKAFSVRPDLAELFRARSLHGSIALYTPSTGELLCSGEGRCDEALVPASTFKIAHTLIGLELGELKSADDVFPWDGQKYSIDAWNKDHTLRSAIEVSCVPCFQQLARRIGEARLTSALQKLHYGTAILGAPIDRFWLEPDGLRISQREQMEFLEALRTRALPVSDAAMEITIDVTPRTSGKDWVLRGKTGMWGDADGGWYVGWLEWGDTATVFATLLRGDNDKDALPAARREVSVAALSLVTGHPGLE